MADTVQKKTALAQNQSEFNAFQWMMLIGSQLPEQRRLKVPDYRRVRSDWGVDFSTTGIRPSHLKQLVSLIGDVAGVTTELDNFKTNFNNTDWIVNQNNAFKAIYADRVNRNMHPTSIIDPTFVDNDVITNPSNNRPFLYTRDKSLHELIEDGSAVGVSILNSDATVAGVYTEAPSAEIVNDVVFDEPIPVADPVVPAESVKTQLEQNTAEFNTLQWMMLMSSDLPDGTPKLNLNDYRQLRANLGVDFATTGLRPSHLKQLASMIEESKGVNLLSVSDNLNNTEWIVDQNNKFKQEYDIRVNANLYPTSIVDPRFTDNDLFNNNSYRKAFMYSRNGSLRELLNDGLTSVPLIDNTGAPIGIYAESGNDISIETATNPFDDVNLEAETEAEDEFDIDSTDVFVGWDGSGKGEDRKPGLKHAIGAYLSGPDAVLASRLISSDIKVTRETAYKSVEILRYLRSNGIDFSIKESKSQNILELTLNGLSNGEMRPNTNLRVFDEKPQYIGRVYDSFNSYYYLRKEKGGRAEPTVNDIKSQLDFIMGRKGGKIVMSKSDKNSVTVQELAENSADQLYISPVKHRFDSIVFNTPEDAEEFLRESIADVRNLVSSDFKRDEINEKLAEFRDLAIAKDKEGMARVREEMTSLYSLNQNIQELQKGYIDDVMKLTQLYADGNAELIKAEMLVSIKESDFDLLSIYDATVLSNQEIGPDDITEFGNEIFDMIMDETVGSYETGFTPGFIIDNVRETSRRNVREATMSALKVSNYDLNKLHGNDFATNSVKDRLIKFDPGSAISIDDVPQTSMTYRALTAIQDTLTDGEFKGVNGAKPEVLIDENGIVKWTAVRTKGQTRRTAVPETISGEIGQIIIPDENGIIKTKFASGENYGLVPGYTGYFSFDGDYANDNRMDRFRVKGFEETLQDQVRAAVRGQMLRPFNKTLNNIPTGLDSSALNGLYHGDVYGKRIDLDFVANSNLDKESVDAILKTLSNRVRFDNQYSEHATTSAATRAEKNRINEEDEAAFSYFKAAGEKNMRILDSDLTNIADLTMTGTGKTQGLIWYLTDGAEVQPDGSVKASQGMFNDKGELVPDKTALQKLDYFKYHDYNAWDRNQMAANQLMTAVHIDENVGTALMDFGGWTFDDSYAASLAFAERNYVPGASVNEENKEAALHALEVFKSAADGETISDFRNQFNPTERTIADALGMKLPYTNKDFLDLYEVYDGHLDNKVSQEVFDAKLNEFGALRKMQRGDKISDFGGNKGTLGIVIDPNMDPAEAEAQNLTHEVAIMKANPGLDIVGAPYSMLSRDNAGVVLELMDGETKDIYDPVTGETLKGAMGTLNVIVTDLTVDHKTHAYTADDIASGKGRKASGQLAWALQSKNADKLMEEIYGDNVGPWSTFREYLITTGLDMKADGTLLSEYTPQKGEIRNSFDYDPEKSPAEFLNQIKDHGGFLKVPFDIKFKNGKSVQTDSDGMFQIPVLSANLRKDTELVDDRLRVHDFTGHYVSMYDNLGEFNKLDEKIKNFTGDMDNPSIKKSYDKFVRDRDNAQASVQKAFDKIQSEIIDRQLNGGPNGKHSFIRDKIMGKRMNNSATAVAIVDPRLDIGDAGMNSAMMASLGVKEGDVVMGWRDPVLRDGAIRAFTVKHDESVHGISINPIADKSHDMDFDGDTMGLIKLNSPEAIKQLQELFGHEANMLDFGAGLNKDGQYDLYFQSGMDLSSAEAKALKDTGSTEVTDLLNQAKANANAKDATGMLTKKALRDLNNYSHKAFRDNGFGGDYVRLDEKQAMVESFAQMVKNKAKGSPSKFVELMDYFGYEVETDNDKLSKQIESGKIEVKKFNERPIKTLSDAQAIQEATGVKSDDTGLAGGFSQKLVAALRDGDMKAALEITYPITQGTLQIKHDPRQAKIINDELSSSLNNLYGGKSADGKQKDISARQFKSEMTHVLSEKLGVDFNEEYLDTIANLMSENGTTAVKSIKEIAKEKGSPLDQVAYGGGYDRLIALAEKNRSLLEGERSQQFAPLKMREATDETTLLKQDILDKVAIQQREVEANLEKPLAKEKSTVDLSNVDVAPMTVNMAKSSSSYDLEP